MTCSSNDSLFLEYSLAVFAETPATYILEYYNAFSSALVRLGTEEYFLKNSLIGNKLCFKNKQTLEILPEISDW